MKPALKLYFLSILVVCVSACTDEAPSEKKETKSQAVQTDPIAASSGKPTVSTGMNTDGTNTSPARQDEVKAGVGAPPPPAPPPPPVKVLANPPVKVTPEKKAENPNADAKADLMSEIKEKGQGGLKHIDPPKTKNAPKKSGDPLMDALKKRLKQQRKATHGDDNSDSESKK